MFFYQYINVFLRREDLDRIKYIQRQQKHEQIDSADSLCADLVRLLFLTLLCDVCVTMQGHRGQPATVDFLAGNTVCRDSVA